MSTAQLQKTIEDAWEGHEDICIGTTGEVRDAVKATLDLLDSGQARVAEKINGQWQVHQWLKKAVLFSFRLNDMTPITRRSGRGVWFAKGP